VPDGGRDICALGNRENFIERVEDLGAFGALVGEIDTTVQPSNFCEFDDFVGSGYSSSNSRHKTITPVCRQTRSWPETLVQTGFWEIRPLSTSAVSKMT
jgi:hypothetical protein